MEWSLKPGKSFSIILAWAITLLVLLAVIRIIVERDKPDVDIPADSISLNVATDCQIEKGCVVSAQNRFAVVKFKSPARYLKPFPVLVNTHGIGNGHVVSVIMEFYMRDMEMPVRPVTLINQDAGHRWQAEGILPVCVSGRRDWIGRLTINTDTTSYKADIVFEVSN